MFISGLFQGLKDIAISKRLYVIIVFIVLWIVFDLYTLAFPSESHMVPTVALSLFTGLVAAVLIVSVVIGLKNAGAEAVKNRQQLEQKIKEVESLRAAMVKERQSAEHYERAKEYFLVNMSHEIRTPMNAILGFANYLEKSLKGEEEIESVKMIVKSGEYLLATLNDILDFVSIQTGEISFVCSPFNLKDTVQTIFMLNESNAKMKEIGITYRIDKDIPDIICGDPARLTQILLNLTSNAVKFTEMGGVLISARSISDHDDHIIIEFSVKDTGIGIDVDMQEKIFNPFEQGANHMKRQFGGTGIGLSLVKHMVALQDGVIEVRSLPGEGSEFCFKLPFLKSHAGKQLDKFAEVEDDLVDESEVGKGINVLIVEDNVMNRELVIKLLERRSYQTSIAENGRVAIEKYESEDFDIILMDLQMPEMDGYETTNYIRSMSSDKKDIPIVAMTAHTIKGEQEKCLSIGMNDFISKPFQARELYEKVRTLVGATTSPDLPLH